jgi:type II secretory pathway component PulF
VQRERREHGLAWGITIVASLHCAWMGFHLWRSTGKFAALYEGLGTQLPSPTRMLVEQGSWIYPLCFGGLIAVLVAKEVMVRDKRLSTMLTFAVAVVAQFLAHWMTTAYYLPLFDLIDKLS